MFYLLRMQHVVAGQAALDHFRNRLFAQFGAPEYQIALGPASPEFVTRLDALEVTARVWRCRWTVFRRNVLLDGNPVSEARGADA